MGILERVEALSGRPVAFRPDSSLSLKASLRMARNRAPAHVLQYCPPNNPIDYWVAYQAAFALRSIELLPAERFDFAGTGQGTVQVEALLKTGQPLTEADTADVPKFTQYRIVRPACWTQARNCCASATPLRRTPAMTANLSMPGRRPSA